MIKTRSFCLFLLFSMSLPHFIGGQEKGSSKLIDSLLKANKHRFDVVLTDPEAYKIQILYTQIDRNELNQPVFTSHSFRLDPDEYFYPASTIKLFAAALALEKINGLNIEGLSKFTRLAIDSSYAGQTAVKVDSTAPYLEPTLAHYIRKMLVISDNDAYNRLYEFIGQKALNQSLAEKGFHDSRLTHRLSLPLSDEENKHTNAFRFYSGASGKEVYYQGPAYNELDFSLDGPLTLGNDYIIGGMLQEGPMDFSKKNATSLTDLQKALREIIFPGTVESVPLFNLTAEDYAFLHQYLSQLPRETAFPDYGNKPDNYCKFFLYGDNDKARIPENIRIFNKIGLAYGFTLDNAYIVDFDNRLEFMLTAVIYTNQNNILNDGKYEYEKLGFPFLAELGRMIYDYELKRKRHRSPDLSAFKINYDKS